MTGRSPWLDSQRFPGRAHLAAVARSHAPLAPSTASVQGQWAEPVRRRWAEHLQVQTGDLVLAATAADAFRLVLQALLAPGDVALVAEPAPVAALGAILAAGAAYVDLGRLHDGDIDAKALARALQAHPDAVIVLEQPSLFGTDDRAALGHAQARALVIDARHALGWAGPADLEPRATATLVALRDPDQPAQPVLHAVVCAPGTGADLVLLQGPACWPEAPMRLALAVLDGLREQPHWPLSVETQLDARYSEFALALKDLAGVRLLPRGGFRAAAECLAGDGAAVALHVSRHLAPVDGFAAHPMRSLVVANLAAVRAVDRV